MTSERVEGALIHLRFVEGEYDADARATGTDVLRVARVARALADEIDRRAQWEAVALGAVGDVAIGTGWALVPESGLGLAMNALALALDAPPWAPETLAWLHRLREVERAATHMDRVMGADLCHHESNVIDEAAAWLGAALAGEYTPDPDLSWWAIVTRKGADDGE